MDMGRIGKCGVMYGDAEGLGNVGWRIGIRESVGKWVVMNWDTGKCGEMWGDAWRCGKVWEMWVEYWDT